jgi:hypothetical protein
MPSVQTPNEILGLLERVVGETVSELRVMGVNSLKTVTPNPTDLVGSTIRKVAVDDRILRLALTHHLLTVDLQRTGRIVWFAPDVADGTSRPTLRLVVASGGRLDFMEPARTKRITLRIVEA